MGKFQPIKLDKKQALTTLVAQTGILGQMTSDTASEGYYAVSFDLNVSWDNATVGDGSMDIYLAHQDWTLAEIEAYIEIATGFDRADKIAQEIQLRGRTIRKVGSLTPEVNNLNDGKPTRVKFRIYIDEGFTLNVVCYNAGAAALTTGSEISWSGQMFGSWAN